MTETPASWETVPTLAAFRRNRHAESREALRGRYASAVVELDARTLDTPALDADVCIVGSGPAGLTVARGLATRHLRVVILESGGRRPDPDAQALNDGATVGDAYAGPRLTRHRQAGGTAQVWNTWLGNEIGAKYVPLDAVDFEARAWWSHSGWPFDRASLDPYYERAQALCGLGPYRYEGKDWASPDRPLLPLQAGLLTSQVYQLGPARLFTEVYLAELRRARSTLLCLHATVVEIETDTTGRSVTQVRAARPPGGPLRVRARLFVLAAGGIENARLLLLSTRTRRAGLGNEFDMVGRCFMEHPRDVACGLVLADRGATELCRFYEVHGTTDGIIMGRLTFTEEARRRLQLPAMSVTLRPRHRMFRWPALDALRTLPRWRRRHLGDWRQGAGAGRRHFDIELLINLEQAPDVANRVTLGAGRDRLGLPTTEIHWRWRDHDRQRLSRIRELLGEELGASGIGQVVVDAAAAPDPNAHHHIGTTRMHHDPRHGVVDEHARVHGLSNLFVAGSSVFPTGGFANPTLTIVALAQRLADHLAGQL